MHKTHGGHLSNILGRIPGDSDCLDWVLRIYVFYKYSVPCSPKRFCSRCFTNWETRTGSYCFSLGSHCSLGLLEAKLEGWPTFARQWAEFSLESTCLRAAQVIARSTLPETPTPLITDHWFCSPYNSIHPASFPHCSQFLHLSLCTLWSSFLCSFLRTLIPFNLTSALQPGVLQDSGMWDIPLPQLSPYEGLIDYFQVAMQPQ